MQDIGDFFSKYKNIEPPERYIKETVIDALKEILDVEIEPERIAIQRDIVFIKTDSIIKNEIFLNKSKILDYISKNLTTKKVINDIK